MRFPIIFRRNIIILISLISGIIHAGVTVVGSWGPSAGYDGTTYRPITGYINQTTDVIITVTLTGADASGGGANKSELNVQVFFGSNTNANVLVITTDLEGHGLAVKTTSTDSENLDVNILEYIITREIMQSASNNVEGKYVDMLIKFENASPDVSYGVDWTGSTPSLKFDTEAPYPRVRVKRASDPPTDVSSFTWTCLLYTSDAADE